MGCDTHGLLTLFLPSTDSEEVFNQTFFFFFLVFFISSSWNQWWVVHHSEQPLLDLIQRMILVACQLVMDSLQLIIRTWGLVNDICQYPKCWAPGSRLFNFTGKFESIFTYCDTSARVGLVGFYFCTHLYDSWGYLSPFIKVCTGGGLYTALILSVLKLAVVLGYITRADRLCGRVKS